MSTALSNKLEENRWGRLCPKSRTWHKIRTTSSLGVKGKYSSSILAKTTTVCLTQDKYIYTFTQNEGIKEFSRCLEHTGAFSHLVQEAEKKGQPHSCVARLH